MATISIEADHLTWGWSSCIYNPPCASLLSVIFFFHLPPSHRLEYQSGIGQTVRFSCVNLLDVSTTEKHLYELGGTGLIKKGKMLRMGKHSPIQAPSYSPEGEMEAGVLRPSGQDDPSLLRVWLKITAVGHIATVVDWKP
ncbi:hypothetical protein JOM56_002608 [Amanita muscaria]